MDCVEYMQKFKFVVLITFGGLASCASEVSNRGVTSQTPNTENQFTGIFATEAIGRPASFTPQVTQLCASLGGLASGPTYAGEGVFTRFFQYRCNGPIAKPQPNVANTEPIFKSTSESDLAQKNKSVEIERVEIPARPVVNNDVSSASDGNRLTLEASKKKCTELGFKPATEGHGKCVLQLSK